MYVSYIDESGKGGPVFVVGGLTAKADPSWLDFSTEWHRILGAPPAIPYFHLSGPQGLSKQENHRKITALIDIINCFVERADLLVIHVEQYKAFFRGKLGATFDNPFHHGYVTIFQQCALELPDSHGKVDFVFDELDDTEYLELLNSYRTFKEICPDSAVKARFGEEPIRRNDEIVLPLQAADLVAGLMRRAYEGDSDALFFLKKIKIDNRAFLWDERTLGELFAKSEARTLGLGLGLFYEGKKMRSKRLGDARKLLRSAPK
jgi:uncharacterized protein DUF3800